MRGERGDPARGVPHDRAEREREDPDEHHVDRAADHRAGDARLRERDLEDVVPLEDRLAREEADEHGGHDEHERDDRVVEELRPEHGQPLRHRREGGADRAGRVLRADHEHAEDGDRELRDVDAGERDVERLAASALAPATSCSSASEVTKEKSTGKTIVSRNPTPSDHVVDRTERSFVHSESEHARERDAAGHLEARHAYGRRDRAHATASSSSAANSTSSRVRFMNASSSDACCGVSSCSDDAGAGGGFADLLRRSVRAPRARRARRRRT